ncbi:4097_t:CDS:2, partial [Acaulospora morrowiae]
CLDVIAANKEGKRKKKADSLLNRFRKEVKPFMIFVTKDSGMSGWPFAEPQTSVCDTEVPHGHLMPEGHSPSQTLDPSGSQVDRKKAKKWESERLHKQIHIHQPISEVNGNVVAGNVDIKVSLQPSSKKRDWKDVQDDDEDRVKKTRSGRNVPNYRGFFDKSSVQIQENKEKNIQYDGSYEQKPENTSKDTILQFDNDTDDDEIKDDSETEGETNKVITDFLGNIVECSKESKNICSEYTKQYPDGYLSDLRLCSSFLGSIPRSIAVSYLSEMDKITESLIPDGLHQFLVRFFSQNISDDEWQIQVDDL